MAESAKRAILHTATLDFGSIAANTTAEATVTLPANMNVRTGAVVSVSAPSLEAGLVATGYVSAANEVKVRVGNVTVGAVDPASQAFYLAVVQ